MHDGRVINKSNSVVFPSILTAVSHYAGAFLYAGKCSLCSGWLIKEQGRTETRMKPLENSMDLENFRHLMLLNLYSPK